MVGKEFSLPIPCLFTARQVVGVLVFFYKCLRICARNPEMLWVFWVTVQLFDDFFFLLFEYLVERGVFQVVVDDLVFYEPWCIDGFVGAMVLLSLQKSSLCLCSETPCH